VKSSRSSQEEKKVGKTNEEKRSRPREVMDYNNIKISQVGLLCEMIIYYVVWH
jgi:hypothetical protein